MLYLVLLVVEDTNMADPTKVDEMKLSPIDSVSPSQTEKSRVNIFIISGTEGWVELVISSESRSCGLGEIVGPEIETVLT